MAEFTHVKSSIDAFEQAPSLGGALTVIFDAVVHPQATFDAMPRGGPLGPPLAFAMALGGLLCAQQTYAGQVQLEEFVRSPAFAQGLQMPMLAPLFTAMQRLATSNAWLGALAAALFAVPVTFALTVPLLHVCMVVVRAAKGGWRETARAVAYTSTGTLLAILPWVGGLFSLIWVSIQLVAGLCRAHDASSGRVVLALSLPAIAVVLAAVPFLWGLWASLVRH